MTEKLHIIIITLKDNNIRNIYCLEWLQTNTEKLVSNIKIFLLIKSYNTNINRCII